MASPGAHGSAGAGSGNGAGASTHSGATNPGVNGSAGAPAVHAIASPTGSDRDDAALFMTGYVRDERGLRFAGEAAD
jgi:hypothetical protein